MKRTKRYFETSETLRIQSNLSDKLERRQMEMFLRKLENGWFDSKDLPSPYTRDVYTTTKDY